MKLLLFYSVELSLHLTKCNLVFSWDQRLGAIKISIQYLGDYLREPASYLKKLKPGTEKKNVFTLDITSQFQS